MGNISILFDGYRSTISHANCFIAEKTLLTHTQFAPGLQPAEKEEEPTDFLDLPPPVRYEDLQREAVSTCRYLFHCHAHDSELCHSETRLRDA